MKNIKERFKKLPKPVKVLLISASVIVFTITGLAAYVVFADIEIVDMGGDGTAGINMVGWSKNAGLLYRKSKFKITAYLSDASGKILQKSTTRLSRDEEAGKDCGQFTYLIASARAYKAGDAGCHRSFFFIKPSCLSVIIRVIIQSKQNNSIFSDISLSDLFKEVPA